MFNHKKIIRNYIFAAFCILILFISLVLTYYVSYYDLSKLKIEDKSEECPIEATSIIGSMIIKISIAFLAGGIISDQLWVKIGTF